MGTDPTGYISESASPSLSNGMNDFAEEKKKRRETPAERRAREKLQKQCELNPSICKVVGNTIVVSNGTKATTESGKAVQAAAEANRFSAQVTALSDHLTERFNSLGNFLTGIGKGIAEFEMAGAFDSMLFHPMGSNYSFNVCECTFESPFSPAQSEDEQSGKDIAVGVYLVANLRGGATRAAKYGTGWASARLSEAIARFAGNNPNITVTNTGKIIYENAATGMQVIEDVSGKYFRVRDPSIPGKRSYLDLNGASPSNKTLDNGKQMGRTQGEYNQVTHFLIEE